MALPSAEPAEPRRPSTPPRASTPPPRASSRPPPGAGDVSTYVPLRRKQRVPALAVAAIGALGLLGAGLGAFFRGARARTRRSPAAARAPAPIVAAAPIATRLRVVSEPPGARVHVDGQQADGVTPLEVTIPAGRRSVWLRLAKSGHLDQEREVSAAVGEARFVLPPLAIEDGEP
ncbi:MAG: PEGA domain-containing protein [Sandaracinaceae bacterium]|nr:PEGA domain-containing protein [Sandaracinaceae bacterium]